MYICQHLDNRMTAHFEEQINKRLIGQTVKRSKCDAFLLSLLSREKASEIRRQTARTPQCGTGNPKRQHFGGSQDRRMRWRFA